MRPEGCRAGTPGATGMPGGGAPAAQSTPRHSSVRVAPHAAEFLGGAKLRITRDRYASSLVCA